MNYVRAEERYRHDPIFKAMVDHMVVQIELMRLTPTEMREAAMLACIIFEHRHPRLSVLCTEPENPQP